MVSTHRPAVVRPENEYGRGVFPAHIHFPEFSSPRLKAWDERVTRSGIITNRYNKKSGRWVRSFCLIVYPYGSIEKFFDAEMSLGLSTCKVMV